MSKARLGPLGLLLALCGCDDEALPAACAGDAMCPPPSPLLSWAADLWPGLKAGAQRPGAPLVPQEEPQLVFALQGHTTLRLSPPAVLRGTLLDSLGAPITRAQVAALLPSRIPGQSTKSFETTTDTAGTFSLRVTVPRRPEEQPYKLWIGFDDAKAVDRPPLWRTGLVVQSDTQLSLQMKRLTELAEVRGRVTDLLGAGVGGMRVQVLDSRREVVSSTAVTLSAPAETSLVGTFRVLLDPTLGTGPLQLVASPGPEGQDLPILSRPLQRLEIGMSAQVDLRLPPYRKPVPITLTVRGKGTSGAIEVVPGARVRAQVFLEQGAQTSIYAALGDTNAEGQVTLPLVPATTANLVYTVSVQSPAGSALASHALDLQVGKEGGFIAVSLPLRPRLSGRIVTSDGMPVARAQVVARNISLEGQATTLAGHAFVEAVTPQTTADEDGRFALWLDQGDYDIEVVPEPGTQPRFTLSNQRVLSDTELGLVALPRPTLGRVVVLGTDGQPVSGVILRVFQLPDTSPRAGFACAEVLPCSHQASLRAEVTTDIKGRAQFLLPDARGGR